MKKLLLTLTLAFCFIMPAVFAGCDFGGGNSSKYSNDNLSPVATETMNEDVNVEEGKDYYSANDICPWFECSGYFGKAEYFYIDEQNLNKRVYDNMYFYKKDYLYMLSDNMRDWYAALSDNHDTTYVEEERENGEEVYIRFKQDGIYTIKFDVETHKLDVIFKAEIVTPKYYTIKGCDFYNGADKTFTRMQQSTTNPDELYLNNVEVNMNKGVSFCSHIIHMDSFKVTIDPSTTTNIANIVGDRDDYVTCAITGKVNIYLNKKTYVVRMEIVDKENTQYYLWVADEKITLQQDATHPYIFSYEFTSTGYSDCYICQNYYNKQVFKYTNLTFIESEDLEKAANYDLYYCTKFGVNKVIINLDTLTVSVQHISDL